MGVNVVAGIYSIMGVETIMKIAMPVLMVFYPVAIVLIIMGAFHKFSPNRGTYMGAAYFTLFVSMLNTLAIYGIDIKLVSWLPLSKQGFGWIVPAIAGLIIGFWVHKKKVNSFAI